MIDNQFVNGFLLTKLLLNWIFPPTVYYWYIYRSIVHLPVYSTFTSLWYIYQSMVYLLKSQHLLILKRKIIKSLSHKSNK